MTGAVFFFGCTTSKIDWNSRVGTYTFDQAVLEFGPPERSAKLSDGRTVSEWLRYRSTPGRVYPFHTSSYYGGGWVYNNEPQFPDRYLRLTFSPEGRLENWKPVIK